MKKSESFKLERLEYVSENEKKLLSYQLQTFAVATAAVFCEKCLLWILLQAKIW